MVLPRKRIPSSIKMHEERMVDGELGIHTGVEDGAVPDEGGETSHTTVETV